MENLNKSIIGHLESGKGQPFKNVYDEFDHPMHADFTAHEHERAAHYNSKAAEGLELEMQKPGVSMDKTKQISLRIQKHNENARKHLEAAASLKLR